SVSGCDGSASTNGAPPSGSPAQRRTVGGSAASDRLAYSYARPRAPIAGGSTGLTPKDGRSACGKAAASRRHRPSERTAIDCNGRIRMATVAFMGTGLLGSGMVEAMLRRGDAVTVWNRTESKARALEKFGALVAASPADAVAAA